MKLHWTEVAAVAALVAAGGVAIYAGLSRALRRAVTERQQTVDRQLEALTVTIKALQLRVLELSEQQTVKRSTTDAMTGAPENAAGEEGEQMKPDTLAVMTAAATTFLGKKARIRAKRAVPVPDAAGAWAQQGRVIVQTSHNLRPGV